MEQGEEEKNMKRTRKLLQKKLVWKKCGISSKKFYLLPQFNIEKYFIRNHLSKIGRKSRQLNLGTFFDEIGRKIGRIHFSANLAVLYLKC